MVHIDNTAHAIKSLFVISKSKHSASKIRVLEEKEQLCSQKFELVTSKTEQLFVMEKLSG